MNAVVSSHGPQMGDAHIAAKSLEHGSTVVTGNVRHFGAVKGMQLDPFVV